MNYYLQAGDAYPELDCLEIESIEILSENYDDETVTIRIDGERIADELAGAICAVLENIGADARQAIVEIDAALAELERE